MSSSITSVTDAFEKWRLDDIRITQALKDGSMLWGDIPFTERDLFSDPVPQPSFEAPSEMPLEKPTPPVLVSKPPYKKTINNAVLEEATSKAIKTIITRNLPRDITVDQLRAVFEKYGPIRDIYIPKNMDKASPYFGTIKGFALIKFLKPTDSAQAYKSEYGSLTIGKNSITVEFAKEDR
jgi:hypothetical protein